jgi:hypothetical protein
LSLAVVARAALPAAASMVRAADAVGVEAVQGDPPAASGGKAVTRVTAPARVGSN